MIRLPLSGPWAYVIAAAGVALATAARLAMAPILGPNYPFVTYFFMLLVTARVCGLGPSILALVLGSLSTLFFFLSPFASAVPPEAFPLSRLLLYLFLGGILIAIVEAERRARRRLEVEIAERRLAEGRLGESERRFSRFMRHFPGLAWIKDGQGRYLYANEAAERAFCSRSSDLYGRTDDEIFPPETAAQFREHDRRALEAGEGVRVVETLMHGDGTLHHSLVSKFPMPGPDGEAAIVGGMAVDITDLMRAEEGLRLSEAQFRAVYDQAAVGIAEVDLSGRFLRANSRYCEIVGYPPEELLGLRFHDITHPDEPGANLAKFARIADGPSSYTIEKRYVRKDGRVVWAHATVSLIRDGEGIPERAVAVVEDVTERVRAEKALQDADRRKDEFLATLAHELRNPLAPIRNALYLMGHGAETGVGFEDQRAMAERQVAHLSRLVDDLMDVARISQGKIELRKEPVDLGTIIGRAVESARSTIAERRHELVVELPNDPIRLEADPTRLEQILWNLLNNAAKYTQPGGLIRLSVEHRGDEAIASVRDTGVGIEPRMLPRLFQMFVQLEDHRRHSQGGLGIGLGLVWTLVELHGGSITAHSDGPGTGSEFVVRLPALSAMRPREGIPAGDWRGSDGSALCRRRILVVDDNVDAALSLSLLLSRVYGQEVRVAHDGPEALAAAWEFIPEVVLLDIGLPGMDGHEVARQLRQRPGSETLLIVALTGWGQDADRQRSKAAGFDHHLIKPVNPADLKDLLAEFGGSDLAMPSRARRPQGTDPGAGIG